MRFLLVSQGSYGDINPCAAIAVRLREHGHQVLFLASEYYEPFLKRLGIEVVSTMSREDNLRITAAIVSERGFRAFDIGLRELVLGPASREYAAIRDLYEPGETVVLAGALALGARIAQEKLGVPIATLIVSPDQLRSIYHPGPLGHRIVPKPARKWMQSLFDRRMNSTLMPQTNRLRDELGLPALQGFFGDWRLFSPQLILGLFPDWYAPVQPDWPKIRLTGFPLFDRADAQELPSDVEEFLGAGEPPLIINALSSMQAAHEFFERSVAAVRRIGARAILLSPFPHNVPANLPQGIRYFGYVPHRLILLRAAGIIHQGGTGTVAGALLAGIPQIIVPVNLIDAPFHGRRIASLGVGARLWSAQYRTRRVASELEKLLSSSTVKERCRYYAAKMKAEDGTGAACRLIEEVFCRNLAGGILG
jgi:UDP:flavonoid glycosyltransferase YjiC (YdhE family)